MAANQQWFEDVHLWVDIQFARGGLFIFDRALTGQQRAYVAVTGVIWLRIPLGVGLGLVTKADVK